MALTHTTAVRNGLADYIDDQVNAGTTDAGGDLVFETSGDVAVATINLQDPAFGAAANGVITLAGTPLEDTNAAGGTIDHFIIQSRDNVEVFQGTVTVTSGGGDIEITSLTIAATEIVRLTSFTYTASA